MKSLYVSAVSLIAVYGSAAMVAGSAGANGMKAFDLNNDDRITQEEASGAIRNFDDYDSDGDGSLDSGEFAQVVERARERRKSDSASVDSQRGSRTNVEFVSE